MKHTWNSQFASKKKKKQTHQNACVHVETRYDVISILKVGQSLVLICWTDCTNKNFKYEPEDGH